MLKRHCCDVMCLLGSSNGHLILGTRLTAVPLKNIKPRNRSVGKVICNELPLFQITNRLREMNGQSVFGWLSYFHVQSNCLKYTILLRSTAELPELYIFHLLCNYSRQNNSKTGTHFGITHYETTFERNQPDALSVLAVRENKAIWRPEISSPT